MIDGIVLFLIGYAIWKKLQDDPVRAWREARDRMAAFQSTARKDSVQNRLSRQASRTKMRQARVNLVNTAEHTQRRVYSQLKREQRRLDAVQRKVKSKPRKET